MLRTVCVVAAALPLLAAPAASADEPQATLAVEPKLCIVDKRTPSCDVALRLSWRSRESDAYCVGADDEAPLRCWVEANQGTASERRKIVSTLSYWLRRNGSENVDASARVEVLRMDSDDRRRRRRTRHVWDVL